MSTLLGRKKAISRPNPNATTQIPIHFAMPCTHIPPSLLHNMRQVYFCYKKRANRDILIKKMSQKPKKPLTQNCILKKHLFVCTVENIHSTRNKLKELL